MPFRSSEITYRISVLGAFVALIGLCVLSHYLFPTLFARPYLAWYLDAGPVIGIATASFAIAWGDLDRNTGLVSANPLKYLGSCLQVVGLPVYVFGEHQTKQVPARERLLAAPLAVAFVVAGLIWVVAIAPLQYFAFLFCAAPSRVAMASGRRVFARLDRGRLEIDARPESENPQTGWWDASMKDHPVTLASAFSAAVWWLLGGVPGIRDFLGAG